MATSDAPVSISRVALKVRNLDRIGDFYQTALGLNLLSRDGESMTLGAADRPLLELRRDMAGRVYPREAGLFHNAFLLPSREDLGRWLNHARSNDIRLDGASDHLVSEAIYLHDPEGNGIEIYADRPRNQWDTDGKRVNMDTVPLNLLELMAAPGTWSGAPDGTVIGHVHLQVGNVAEAEKFYVGELGFDLTSHIPSASFFATGGYHHHLAGNVWNSRGAGKRPADALGLAEVELRAGTGSSLQAGLRSDPWGNAIRVTRV
ncbi:MAG: VOC family protein [Paracoccus sp. (in: a-proteobacteria)]|uniref:VOC family protein n=1 Tax=Paracoccus sp. TaxID=267 RepID=UPI0026DED1C3|nr:VOC family protein [Paracoccus sp. (in: a-proteobacteria)]MDO5620775.1 VOC family protein [Paracoccus sp. (in: a-proteobacteria)]